MPVTVAVTLRYETIPITIDRIRRDLHSLHFKVDRKIFGRDFHLSPTRTTYWGVIEMLDYQSSRASRLAFSRRR